MAKRRLIGTIKSVKMHETALVEISRLKEHPLYGKRYRRSTVYAAHNPENLFNLGDVVEIEEHRPISKTKHWLIRSRIGASTSDTQAGDEGQEIVRSLDAVEVDEPAAPSEPEKTD